MNNQEIVELINKIENNTKSIFIRYEAKNVALFDLPTNLAIKTVCEMLKQKIMADGGVGIINEPATQSKILEKLVTAFEQIANSYTNASELVGKLTTTTPRISTSMLLETMQLCDERAYDLNRVLPELKRLALETRRLGR